jgi:hypothetical protein
VNDKMSKDEFSMSPPASKKLRTLSLETAQMEGEQQLRSALPQSQELGNEGPSHHLPQHALLNPALALQNEVLLRSWLFHQCVPSLLGYSSLTPVGSEPQDESSSATSFAQAGPQPLQTPEVTGRLTVPSEIVEKLLRGHMNPDFTLLAAQACSPAVPAPLQVSTKPLDPTSVLFASAFGVQSGTSGFAAAISSETGSEGNSKAPSSAALSFGRENRTSQAESTKEELLVSQRRRGRVVPLSLPSDKSFVSEYQVLLREQIDLFEEMDLTARAQGRNKPIELNSVGIRCRHCAYLHAGFRPRGAVYFPTKLIGLYHSSQNMAANHFASGSCTNTPVSVMHMLAELRECKSIVYGRNSQRYWEQSALQQGVREVGGRLVFSDTTPHIATVSVEYETNSAMMGSSIPSL